MSLLHLDGCDELSTTPGGWLPTGAVTLVPGRFNYGYRTLNGHSLTYTVLPPARTDTMTLGFAVYFTTHGSRPAPALLAAFQSDSGATTHAYLRVNVDGSVNLIHGSQGVGGTLLNASTSDGVFTVNTWHHIQVTVTLSDTVGSGSFTIDGSTYSDTSADTRNGGTSPLFDTLRLGMIGGTLGTGESFTFDDIYVRNDNVRMGEVVVETVFPNDNGALTQWVGSDGNSADNYLLVNERPMSTANFTASPGAIGQRDLYNYPPIRAKTGLAVKAVEHVHYLDNSVTAEIRQARLLHRAASGTLTSSDWHNVVNVDARYSQVLETDPQTSGAWTVAAVNAVQNGVENGDAADPGALWDVAVWDAPADDWM